jgi:predicted ester cyclase
MSTPQLELARRWFKEVWNEGRAETIHELMHPEAICHLATGTITGPDAWKSTFWDPFVGAFSEIKVEVEDAISDGERVAVRWSAAMRHTGPHIGIPETGRALRFSGMTWLRVRDGRVVEGWDGWDSTGMLVSIGGAQLHPNLARLRQ